MVARAAQNGSFQEYDLIPSSPMAIFVVKDKCRNKSSLYVCAWRVE